MWNGAVMTWCGSNRDGRARPLGPYTEDFTACCARRSRCECDTSMEIQQRRWTWLRSGGSREYNSDGLEDGARVGIV